MVIIAGKVYVRPEDRDEHLAAHQDLIRRAREYPGCLDLVIAADPLEAGRVNLFEQWESEERLAAWRAVANAPAPVAEILTADVQKHQVSRSGPPFGAAEGSDA